MTALAAPRINVANASNLVNALGRPAATGKTFYEGAIVVVNASGYLQPCTGTFGEKVVGVCDFQLSGTFITTGSDGDFKVNTKTGIFPFVNGTSTDALTQADVGNYVFALDDQTAVKTDGGTRRPVLGQLVFVESGIPWVAIGFFTPNLIAQQVSGFGSAPDAISAAGALSLNRVTIATVTGTTAYTLPDGTVLGQIKRVIATTPGSAPVGTITPATPRGFANVTAFGALGDFVEFEWTATGWILGPTNGVTVA